VGLYSGSSKNLMLDALAATITHVQLHTGPPGASGTANVATGGGATRQAVSWAASSSGTVTTSGGVTWSVPAGSYSYVSFWTALSGGTFRGSDDLPATQTLAGAGTVSVSSITLDLNATADAT
jgi:hypothetical protein